MINSPIILFLILTTFFTALEIIVFKNAFKFQLSKELLSMIGMVFFWIYLWIISDFNKLVKTVKEIQAIGIKDWIWFVFYLNRDEFSNKLSLVRYYPDRMQELVKDRQRAHIADMKLTDLNSIKL